MKPFQFAGLPSNSAVAALVTMIVSGWFVLASGAILTDQHSEHTIESARSAPAQVTAIAPEARLTIVVEASRGS
jgi:hypothetical protein